MTRRITLIILLFLLGAALRVSAQQRIVVTGTVVADSLPLSDAAVIVNASDTMNASRRTVLTDQDGKFRLATRLSKPEVTISYIGYKKFVRKITERSGTVDLGTIRMEPEPMLTEDVTVQAKAPMTVIKGDTLQFNASAFKTNPDATSEELLKKMPGIATDANGNLTAQGEQIKKVYVDGKEFFSEQPKTALKNLPAYTVKNVQLYDDKSEKAKFTGVDDGERVKTVNIVTKNGVSTSTFGKVYGGYGTDSRYTGGGGVHLFRENHRLTVTAQANNVNGEGENLNDVSGMGGGMVLMGSGRGGGERTSRTTGLNYSGEFDKKLKLNGNYTFDNSTSEYRSTSLTDYLTQDRHSADTSLNHTDFYRHNLMLSAEWKPNETNRITFRPRVGLTTSHGNSLRRQKTQLDGALSNLADNRYRNEGESYNFSGDLSWMHRFKKEGRTLSLYATIAGNGNETNGYQDSYYGNPDAASGLWTRDTIRQKSRSLGPGISVSGSVSYTEPLSKSSSLNAGYDIHYNKSRSDRRGLNWDAAHDDYTILDTVTTNLFDRNQTRQAMRLGYSYNAKKKVYFNASVRYEFTGLHDTESFPEQRDGRYTFGALLPLANLSWRPSKEHNLGLYYSRYTQVPSVDQLQEVYNITDPLYVTTGNPNLKQSYSDNVNLYYNYYNQKKSIGAGFGAYASFMADAITYHRRFLTESVTIQGITIPKGAQFTSPVNLGGGSNLSLNGNVYATIKPIKCNIGLGLRYSYNRMPSIEDNVVYRSQRHAFGGNVSLNSNISEKVDFSLGYSPGISLSRASKSSFERIVNHDLTGRFQLNVWKGLILRGDAVWRTQSGTRDSYSQSYALVNAGIGYKFLKFRQAEFRVTGYDLLDQNRSFRQSSFETYIQSTTTNVLRRYFMFSFSYTFDSRRKGAAAESNISRNNESTHRNAPAAPARMVGGGRRAIFLP